MGTDRSGTGATVRPATSGDYEAVAGLLRAAQLPLDGVPRMLTDFYVAERGGRVLGAIGLEVYGSDGLLRSVVVEAGARSVGIGVALVDYVLGQARFRALRAVYLLTTTAERYFPRFGFSAIARDDVPHHVSASVEFREACPASAVVMRKVLARE